MSEVFPPLIETVQPLFSNYNVTDLIYYDEASATYEATQVNLDRKVDLIIVPRGDDSSSDSVEVFSSEAKLLGKMNHESILGLIDFGATEEYLYLIVEHVEGSTLLEAMNGSAIELLQSCEITQQILSGMRYAHKRGVVHGNIQPENILIDQNFAVKIKNFGLTGHTPTEATQMTDREQAIGVLIYLRTGHKKEAYSSVPHILENLDPALHSIVTSCLCAQEELRYQTTDALVEDFDALLEEAVEEAPVSHATPAAYPQTMGAAGAASSPAIPTGFQTKKKSMLGPVIILLIVIGAVVGGISLYKKYADELTTSPEDIADSEIKYGEEKTGQLLNSSFELEDLKDGILDGWTSKTLSTSVTKMKLTAFPHAVDGKQSLSINNGIIRQKSEVLFTQHTKYTLSFSLAKISPKTLNGEGSVKVIIRASGLQVRTFTLNPEVKDFDPKLKNFKKFTLEFSDETKSSATGFPIDIEIQIKGEKPVVIDNIVLKYTEPIKTE